MSAAWVTFTIGNRSWSVITGSEIYYDAERYDHGSPGAVDAVAALNVAARRAHGYIVAVSPAGAETIADYCATVGATFMQETETDTRRDGRALLATAAAIREAIDAS